MRDEGEAARVERVDAALALPPFEAQPVGVTLGGRELHGGRGRAPRCRARRAGPARGPSSARSKRPGAGGERGEACRRRRRAPPRGGRRGPRPPTTSTPRARWPTARPRRGRARPGSSAMASWASSCAFASVTSVAARCTSTRDLRRQLVEAVAGGPRGTAGRRRRSRPSRAGAACAVLNSVLAAASASDEPRTRVRNRSLGDHVGLVEREVGDELDGAPGPVGWQLLGAARRGGASR